MNVTITIVALSNHSQLLNTCTNCPPDMPSEKAFTTAHGPEGNFTNAQNLANRPSYPLENLHECFVVGTFSNANAVC